jgi:transposase
MALGRQRERQADMLVSWLEMPRSRGHAFYDKLQTVLVASDFDGFVEGLCASKYAPRRGRPSLPPGRYFRMLLVGYFEGVESERGLERRCADSLSLREFLRLGECEPVPDHSWLSRTRRRLPLEVHDQVFTWVLARLAEHGLIKGERIGVDASTMETNAALRTIVRRDSGEGSREMLMGMAKESGIETPTAEDLIRLDRNRTGKKLCVSRTHRLSKKVWCCTRDEGRPLEVGSQVQASNHCKLRLSKTTVVSVAEKPGLDFGRYDSERRAQANRR